MIKKLSIFILAAVMVSLVALSLPGISLAADQDKTILVTNLSQSPRHLNNAVQSGIATMFLGAQVFASPLIFDDKWQPHPYLAKSWKVSKDGLSVTLNLVKNATFHDGKPVTSKDVAFSIMTIKNNHPFKTMLAPVEKVDTPDAYTAIIRLSRPHPAILLALSPPLCPIIPEHIFGDGQPILTHPMNLKPIGSGPFKFVEFKPGEYVILEAYDKFFLGAPHIKKLIAKVILDPVTRITAVEQKECQMVGLDSVTEVKRIEKMNHLRVEPAGQGVGPLNWLAFNTKHKPLDNKLVRQAISYAIDRQFIVDSLHLGVTKRATGPIHPSSPLYSSKINRYDLNLAKAAALLDQAGLTEKNGVRFAMTLDYIPGSPEQQKNIAEYLKAQLKKVGIDVNIRTSPDFPTWANRVSNWEFEATLDVVYNWGDPIIGVHRTYLSDNIRKGVIWSNTQQYSNPKVDDLLDKAGKETNLAKRKALYAEFQQIVVDDAPLAFINTLPMYMAYDKKLRNVNKTIWGSVTPLHEVYWEK